MNINAMYIYADAMTLSGDERTKKIRDGVACFRSLTDALDDAEENIERYSKCDFMAANSYEIIKSEILRQIDNVEKIKVLEDL